MRFSLLLCAAGPALALSWHAFAHGGAPADPPDTAPVSEAVSEAAPAAPPVPSPQDEDCVTEPTRAFEESLGEPVAWPEDGQTVHTPAGLSVLDRPVSYVLVKRGSGGEIEEVGYRLSGLQRRIGQPHDRALLKAFDDAFQSARCAGSTQSSCGVVYRPTGTPFTGAEIGSGEIDVARSARGPALGLIKADYDLLDADPVFLVCFYRGK